MYALVLRMAGTPPHSQESGHVANDYSSIDAMCEVTGGRSYAVTSHRMLHQCIDSLVQKLQSGVVIHFEKIGPEPPPPTEEALKAEEIARADTVPLDDLDLGPVAKMLERESNGSLGNNRKITAFNFESNGSIGNFILVSTCSFLFQLVYTCLNVSIFV